MVVILKEGLTVNQKSEIMINQCAMSGEWLIKHQLIQAQTQHL